MFKSALGYLAGAAGGVSSTKEENEFLGQTVSLNGFRLRVIKAIAEGGFGFVYLVQDAQSGKNLALKRMFSVGQESADSIEQEIRVLKQLNGHPNVVHFCAASSSCDTQGSLNGQHRSDRREYLILTELCPGGSVVEALNRGEKLTPHQVLKVFYQCCKAVHFMHSQQPPLTHRDLKLENLLISHDGSIKLCDFGSSTTAEHHVDESWTALRRSLVEDEVQRNTTPMYRAPECLDTYNNFPIDCRLDIWALGCVLFVLCYRQHPFADAAKLAILNAKYTLPSIDSEFGLLQPLIRAMLKVDPRERPCVGNILKDLEVLAADMEISSLSDPAFPIQHSPPTGLSEQVDQIASSCSSGQSSTAVLLDHPVGPNLMTSIKGGAGSLLKRLGDTSSKVIQIAQQSIGKSDLDLHYITNRLAVMSYPAEGLESTYRNRIEDVRAALEARHQNNYMVVNISGRSYTNNKFPGIKVVEKLWNQKRAPPLGSLLEVCHTMYTFLGGKRNVVVVHCLDGKSVSALLVASFMLYCGVFVNLNDALKLFNTKRFPVVLTTNQMRYLHYFHNIIRRKEPHSQIMSLVKITMHPPPLFTKLRDGCRPFINVYMGEECVFSTCLEYGRLVHYSNVTSDPIDFNTENTRVSGDVTIVVNHARASTFAKSRVQAIPILQLQFFTGFMDISKQTFTFGINELDLGDDQQDRFASEFKISVYAHFTDNRLEDLMSPLNKYLNITTQPKLAFATEEEMSATIEQFKSLCPAPRPARPPPPLASFCSEAADAAKPSALPQTSSFASSILATEDDMQEAPGSLHAPIAPAVLQSVAPNVKYADTVRQTVISDDLLSSFGGVSMGYKAEGNDSGVISCENTVNENKTPYSKVIDPFGLDASLPLIPPVADCASNDARKAIDDLLAPSSDSELLLASTEASSNRPFTTSDGDLFGQWTSFMATGADEDTKAQRSEATKTPSNTSRHHLIGTLPNGLAKAVPTDDLYASYLEVGIASSSINGDSSLKGDSSRTSMPFSQSNLLSSKDSNLLRSDLLPEGDRGRETGSQVSQSTFDDLLGSQGFANFGKKKEVSAPRTMAEMKREGVAKETDPVRLLVYEWTKGKQKNIRALLCSLHCVVWPDARWAEIGMHQLIGVSDVKKMYRKACLAVHPDKLAGSEKEELAKLIFMELNDAWAEFEKQQGLL